VSADSVEEDSESDEADKSDEEDDEEDDVDDEEDDVDDESVEGDLILLHLRGCLEDDCLCDSATSFL